MTRKITLLCAALTLLMLRSSHAAWLEPQSKLWLEGDSSLHEYSSHATVINSTVEFQTSGTDKTTPESVTDKIKNGQMKVLDVRIPVKEMKSGKGGLDKNMRKSLKAEEFPEIQFHLLNYQTLASTITADGILIKATGQLKIAGVEKTIDIDAQAIKNQEGVKIEGTKELLMTDYGIKPPTLLMIKTRDLVVVYFDFLIDEKTEKP